jgi:hypothetical protein
MRFPAFLLRTAAGIVFVLGWNLSATRGAAVIGLAPSRGVTGEVPVRVMAASTSEWSLTVASSVEINPEALADLVAVAGTLGAPVFTGRSLGLKRQGAPTAGVQRFSFAVEIPAAERKQTFVLRLRVRLSPDQPWLSMPVQTLEATPSTWKDTLRRVAQETPMARLTGGRWEKIAAEVGAKLPAFSAEEVATDRAVRIWLADAADDAVVLPEIPAGAVWVVLKPGLRQGIEVRRLTAGTLVVTVAERVLGVSAGDAGAQDLLEEALATAQALAGGQASEQPL